MLRRQVFLSMTIVAVSVAARPASAADDHDFFEKRIRPVLVEHCYECHSASARKIGGNLRLDTRDGTRRGGDSGPAIVPGDPSKSLLLQAVRYGDDSLQMPPKGKLSSEAIANLERWIKTGAADPRIADAASPVKPENSAWSETLRARRAWWSLQPVKKPPVPETSDTNAGTHPVDRFLAAHLKSQSLALAPHAELGTLARRLSFVLTGLPPKQDVIDALVAGKDQQSAYAAMVDRMLASPHFGERWARHWMDIVRFSETHGNEWNYEVHYAWRYRDYLIRAFNADVAYDQLVREHIAGDLLPRPRLNTAEHFNESVIGTGFYRFGEVNHDDCIGLRQIGYDLVDNQLDTLTKTFQATTVACARCHDHKIDAISARDYHALLGILRSSRLVSHTIDTPEVNRAPLERLKEVKAEIRPLIAAAWARDAEEVAKYMQAAAARHRKQTDAARLAAGLEAERLDLWQKILTAETSTVDEPFDVWRTLVREPADDAAMLAAKWQSLVAARRKLQQERLAAEKSHLVWADFRRDGDHGWEVGGQGFRERPTKSGEFVVARAGEALVGSVVPAGYYTHALSDKLNGTLRSPQLPETGKHVSFQVVGRHSSAVRLVSNHCQLNYKNYRALTSDEPTWITFPIPDERATLRNYVELMTMLDNPKFPDQLSSLGGDKQNYRLPWDQAAGDRRSYFGVTQVVLHDDPKPPEASLGHLSRLLDGPVPQTLDDVARNYAGAVRSALRAWTSDACTDDDVRWLSALLKHGLLRNSTQALPEVAQLFADYRRIENEIQSPRVVPGMGDFGSGIEQPIFIRGDWQRPGPPAPRGYLEVFGDDAFASIQGSGRLELAARISSADNPLTARVMVNRIWHHLFGAGLVRTVDDFGRIGDLPSHPELLDYLAARFVEEGWSTKQLIRLIVTSQTFQAAATPSAAALQSDPENRLLSHFPARRLEAEAIRDTILTASGRLDPTLYGSSVQPFREQANADRRLFPGPLDGAGRRSVYIKFNLMESPKFLGAFNLPGGKVAQGRRDATQVPAQALALLNDPFVLQQAEVWAERLCKSSHRSTGERIDAMFRTAYGRLPANEERSQFEAMVETLAKLHGVADERVLTAVPVWRDAAHALFITEEFIYIP
ncbi:MAG: PSD1 and planctomycete cytochrome C domain-containing protein [Planctomycetia bacterium]|nr:PSD1 and planctomycete cytochrome C domain-containing protein [Planctomycetia bacterium]